MKRDWKDWLYSIFCAVFGALIACYAYVNLHLLIKIWRSIQ